MTSILVKVQLKKKYEHRRNLFVMIVLLLYLIAKYL